MCGGCGEKVRYVPYRVKRKRYELYLFYCAGQNRALSMLRSDLLRHGRDEPRPGATPVQVKRQAREPKVLPCCLKARTDCREASWHVSHPGSSRQD